MCLTILQNIRFNCCDFVLELKFDYFVEISRIEKGESKDRAIPWITIHTDQPQHVAVRVRIPVKEHPKVGVVN